MKPYARITLAYLIFGIFWILVSDTLVFMTVDSSEELTRVQVLKGWLFVFLSSALIYYLTRQAFQHREKMRKQRRMLFLKTVSESYHVLLNFLNQMQLVILEAEKSKDFDQEVLEIARKVSAECSEKIRKLEKLDQDFDFDEQDIQEFLTQVREKLDESSRLRGL